MKFPNDKRKDSQGICFLGKIKFREFLKYHLGEKKGVIVNADSHQAIGTHQGQWFYTIGQRHGLGLSGGPWYVVGKDVRANVVYISNRNSIALKKNIL